MSLYRTQHISQENLLTIAANILDKAFFDSSRVLAKRRFQALERGDRVFLVNVTMESGRDMRVDARLDRSEARCHYNFSAFRDLVGGLLVGISQRLKSKQPLPVFSTGDGRRWSYLIPSVHRGPEGDDMLILALDGRSPGTLTIELMFIDPTQFQAQAASGG